MYQSGNLGSPKSSLTAGVLGILLGGFGVHEWYLGNSKKAKRHLLLLIVGVVLVVLPVIIQAITPSLGQFQLQQALNSIAIVLRVLGWLTLVADIAWGIIDGILLLVQGDVGLIAQGYTVNGAPGSANISQAQTSITPENAPKLPRVSLPPAPTLAEQASNAKVSPQPIVFRSSDIPNQPQGAVMNQAIGTGNVAPAPLTVANAEGKSTINPVVLRRILFTVVIVVAVVVVGLIVVSGIGSVMTEGYGEAYRLARELKPKLERADKSSSCQYAMQYVQAANVGKQSYDEYITVCKDLVTSVNAEVYQLGEKSLVQTNTEIAAQYQDFKGLYGAAFPEVSSLPETLALYQVWHNYVLAVDRLSLDTSPEIEFQQAADILRTSNNEALQKYGEEWLQKQLDYVRAYKAYQDVSYTDPNKENMRAELATQLTELQNWVQDHRPDITQIAPMTVPDTAPMYQSFLKLYELIRTGYEEHYDDKSGDCNRVGDKVYCQ